MTDPRLTKIDECIEIALDIISHSSRSLANPANDHQTIIYLKNLITNYKNDIRFMNDQKKEWKLI